MKKILVLLFTLFTLGLSAQISCNELQEYVEENGNITSSYCCFDSEFLTGVNFYTLTLDYQTYYFAVVQINYYTEYIFCVSYDTEYEFSQYAYTRYSGEAYHKLIKPLKCNCY